MEMTHEVELVRRRSDSDSEVELLRLLNDSKAHLHSFNIHPVPHVSSRVSA